MTTRHAVGANGIKALVICTTMFITLAESASESTNNRTRRQTREEEDAERYQKPFAIIASAIFLAVAPVLLSFIHCLFTDPVVPLLWTQMKKLGKKILVERFGNLNLADGTHATKDN